MKLRINPDDHCVVFLQQRRNPYPGDPVVAQFKHAKDARCFVDAFNAYRLYIHLEESQWNVETSAPTSNSPRPEVTTPPAQVTDPQHHWSHPSQSWK